MRAPPTSPPTTGISSLLNRSAERRNSVGGSSTRRDTTTGLSSIVSSVEQSTPQSAGSSPTPTLTKSNSKSSLSLPPLGTKGKRVGHSMSTTTTTVQLSSDRVSEFGLEARQAALVKVQSQSKNVSPFDPNMFLPMLRPAPKSKEGKITLVLDIDETLVHASVKPRADLKYDTVVHIPDTPDAIGGDIFVAYRPQLSQFLRAVAPMFEVIVFTASQSCYANPLMDAIDPDGVLVTDRLYREHCVEVEGGRIKDLSLLGRSLERMIIIDNSPIAYCFQPRNAIPILSWFDDSHDNELMKLMPFLRQIANCQSVYPMLDMYNASVQ